MPLTSNLGFNILAKYLGAARNRTNLPHCPSDIPLQFSNFLKQLFLIFDSMFATMWIQAESVSWKTNSCASVYVW